MKTYKKIVALIVILLCLFGITLTNAQETLPAWDDESKALYAAINYNGRAGIVKKSTDGGVTWKECWNGEMDGTAASRLNGIACGNGKIVAVGNVIITSEDKGKTWKETVLRTSTGANYFDGRNFIKSVAYGDGMFVAAGPFHVMYSTDGINWNYVGGGASTNTKKATGTKKKLGSMSLKDLKKKATLKSTSKPSSNKPTSEKGGNFPPQNTQGLKFTHYVLYANNQFYVFGGFKVFEGLVFKKDGDKLVKVKELSFTGNAAQGGGALRAAWDGESTITILSDSHKTAYSTDNGDSWKYKFNPAKKQAKAIAFNNGQWVAASPFNDAFYTNDISAGWQAGARKGERGAVNDMVYANGRYILVANDNLVFGSKDGINWENIKSKKDYGHHIRAIAYVVE